MASGNQGVVEREQTGGRLTGDRTTSVSLGFMPGDMEEE
jgi:hypothetical protein